MVIFELGKDFAQDKRPNPVNNRAVVIVHDGLVSIKGDTFRDVDQDIESVATWENQQEHILYLRQSSTSNLGGELSVAQV